MDGATFPLDQIGEIVETCDNLLSAAKLPLPAATHVQGLTGGVEKIRDIAFGLYVAHGGDPDTWSFDEAAAVEAASDRRP